jgi:hypothetical protein
MYEICCYVFVVILPENDLNINPTVWRQQRSFLGFVLELVPSSQKNGAPFHTTVSQNLENCDYAITHDSVKFISDM